MDNIHTEDSVPPLSEKSRTRAARVVVEEGQRITRVEEIDDSIYNECGYQGLRGYTTNRQANEIERTSSSVSSSGLWMGFAP